MTITKFIYTYDVVRVSKVDGRTRDISIATGFSRKQLAEVLVKDATHRCPERTYAVRTRRKPNPAYAAVLAPSRNEVGD